jgi:hypothetical protein
MHGQVYQQRSSNEQRRAGERKYMHLVVRILITLMAAAMAFVLGVFLPLSFEWILHGDPGMPGGAALAFLGFPLGVAAAVVAGLFSFVKLPAARRQNSK